MGTRSTIRVVEKAGRNSATLVNIYQQFDGYLEGVGKELCQFLSEIQMVNGFRGDEKTKIANGVGCLAAQIVAHFKKEPGGTYLIPASQREEFNYCVTVTPKDERRLASSLKIRVTDWENKPIFDGTVEGLAQFIKEQEEA